jgi:transcriptional regulator of acetoin/glycerol metabolism
LERRDTPSSVGYDLPTPAAVQPALTLEEMERTAIMEALDRSGNNVSQACRQLGMGRTTMYRKLIKYGLRV